MVSSVYFCATKLEAFARRGKDDFQRSRDLEDFIAVVGTAERNWWGNSGILG
jgi:hypothetical protein